MLQCILYHGHIYNLPPHDILGSNFPRFVDSAHGKKNPPWDPEPTITIIIYSFAILVEQSLDKVVIKEYHGFKLLSLLGDRKRGSGSFASRGRRSHDVFSVSDFRHHLLSVRAVRTTVMFLHVQADTIDVGLSIARYLTIKETKKAASSSIG
jgi:hypothetical protein